MALITINGVPLKDPSTYSGQTSTLVDGGRNTEGFFIGDVIRYDMAKVEASWKILSDVEWSNILKLFNPTYGGAFIVSVTFLDQVTNTYQTREMYVSDRKSSIKVIKEGNKIYYQNPSLSLVEV
mgnify:FL=1